jgi:hypothetical protein
MFELFYKKYENSIFIHYGNDSETIHMDDPRYKRIKEAIDQNTLEKIPAILEEEDISNVKKMLKIRDIEKPKDSK